MILKKNFIVSFFLILTYLHHAISDDETTISTDNSSTSLVDITVTKESVTLVDNSTLGTISPNATIASNMNNSSNSTSSDDYVYEVYVYEDVVANDTSNASKFHFSGDDQPRPGLGINLGWITPDMDQWVFTNKFKHAKDWRPCSTNNDWHNFSWTGGIQTTWDSNGYPVNFTGQWGGKVGYLTEIGTSGNYPIGEYLVTWEGTGNISLLGDPENVTVINSNRIEFIIRRPTTSGIIVIITKPNTTNIDLREKFEENLNCTFGTNFTNAIKPFQALRFSPWMVNRVGSYFYQSNTNTEWETRRPKTFYTQVGQNMVSIELMIELANLLNKDIWLSIPSSASPNYILKMAQYVKDNLINQSSLIYVEQSSDKNFANNNKTLELQLVKIWNQVQDHRVRHVLAISAYPFFNNPPTYNSTDYKNFHYYSVAGAIANSIDFKSQLFDVNTTANYTIDDIIELIRQEIYKDEIELIKLINKVTIEVKKPLIAYDVGFRVSASNYANRWKKTPSAGLEQRLEDLVIEALKKPIVKDLYLDYMERWYKTGGGFMFLQNLVDKIDRCSINVNHYCGYHSLLENLCQTPESSPKYQAALLWLNGTRGKLPFTSTDIPQQQYLNCTPSCVWGTCYNGSCICYTGYSGSACDQKVSSYLDCAPNSTRFGMNIGGLSDWSTEFTFTNIQRRSRKWIIQKIVFGTKWADYNQEDVTLDDDGYPKYLEINKAVGTFLVRDVQAHFPNGNYVVLYDGDGVLDFSFDCKSIRRDAGRILLYCNWTTQMNNGLYYQIIRTNPSNPVRNIRAFEERFENTYQFFHYHPLYLELMKKYSVIRFMPVSNVNVPITEVVDWENRTKLSDYTFTLKTGISIEYQVNLCNILGCNPWFNIPYQATDEYIINWATYVRDNLRPDVNIYIEQGNECWGAGDAHMCGTYAQQKGLLENLTIIANQSYYGKDLQARICYHAKVGKHYSDLIKSVFGPQNRSRLKFVLGTQAAWFGPIEIFFLCPNNVSLAYDVVAIAPYLSNNMTNSDKSLISVDDLFNKRVSLDILDSVNCAINFAKFLKSKAPWMELATYESGPDYSSLTDTNNIYLTNLSYFIHRDPRIYNAVYDYVSNLTDITRTNLKTFMYYGGMGLCSKYGCWGIIEASDWNIQDSPKFRAYNDLIDSKKICNWIELDSTCPNNCSSVGVCTKENGLSLNNDRCYCFAGYKATKNGCEIDYVISNRCTYQCGGKGKCEFDRYEGFYEVWACHCNEGYYGYGCGLFECSNECNYNGLCVDRENCSCYRGYKGNDCSIDCGCNGNGKCSNSSNTCICDKGYSLVGGQCQLDCSVDPFIRPECLTCPSSCVYGDCVLGQCVCWAGYMLDQRKTCTIKTNAPNDGVKLGINLNGVADWSTQWAFVDLFRAHRNWIIQHIEKLNDLYIWSLNEKIVLTNEGYPAVVPHERQIVTIMLRDVQQNWPNGKYHVYYDGDGVIEFGFDAKIVENDKNKMLIMVNLSKVLDNGVFMKIKKTNPKNPIRNLRVVMHTFEYVYEQLPFHPLFLDRLTLFKTIRFMDWTMQDDIVSWDNRTTKTRFPLGNGGVAYEDMIHLCNILKTNCWLIVPYAADDDYIFQLATLVLKLIRTDVKIYIEYTNEAWNEAFNSGLYCIQMGQKLGLSSDPVIARNLFYSKRSLEMIKIFQQVFKSESDRIVLVLGTFTVMPIMSERILSYNDAYKSHSNIMLAITGYFGCGDWNAAVIAVSDISIIFNNCDKDVNDTKVFINNHLKIANKYGVKLGMYESGAGLVEYNAMMTGKETPGTTAKYIAANRDIRMFETYKKYYRMFNTFNLTENCHYGYVGLPSKYGSWFLLEYQTQDLSTAHKYRAMMDLINETRVAIQEDFSYTCSGILFNESTVCDGLGICVKQDTCQKFPDPQPKSEVIVSPLTGQALVEKFYFKTDPWLSNFPLEYAFGINQQDGSGFARITEYSEKPYAFSILPYIGKPYEIVIYVQDSLDRVFNNISTQKVNPSMYTGSSSDLENLMSQLSEAQKLILLFDKSTASTSASNTIINSLNLTSVNDSQKALESLESLTNKYSSAVSSTPAPTNIQVVNTIVSKVGSFLSSLTADRSLANQLTASQAKSTVNIISNLYESMPSTSSENLVNSLAKALVIGNQSQLTTSQSITIPSVQFNSRSFNIVISKVKVSDYKTKGNYVSQSDASMDLGEIFSGVNSNKKGGIVFVKYAKKTVSANTRSLKATPADEVASSSIDLKFYSDESLLNVSGLSNPIKLDFDIDSSININQANVAFALICKYYDETSTSWKSTGCRTTLLDKTNRKVKCECNHATKFAVVKDTTCTSYNLDQCVSNSKALKIHLNKFSTLSAIILILFIKKYFN